MLADTGSRQGKGAGMALVAGGFGRRFRSAFALEGGLTYLNHGAFGAVPVAVAEAQAAWRRQIEGNPTRFFTTDGPVAIRAAADGVARRFGGKGEDWAFVPNATTGISALLAGMPLSAGQTILTTDLAYPSVRRGLDWFAARAGAGLRVVALPLPLAAPGQVLAAVAAALAEEERPAFAVFDHIASPTGAVLPVADLAALCRARGVPVLVDGAHAPGQVALDVPALGVDAYVGNLHKWCFAPRGAGILWVGPGLRGRIVPPVIAATLDEGFPRSFDYLGTADFTPWLTAADGFAFADIWGADAVAAGNAALAREGAALLARAWNTGMATAPGVSAAMAAIRLPLSDPDLSRLGAAHGGLRQAGLSLARALRLRHGIEVPIISFGGLLWARVSVQIYNERADIERLAAAMPQVLAAHC